MREHLFILIATMNHTDNQEHWVRIVLFRSILSLLLLGMIGGCSKSGSQGSREGSSQAIDSGLSTAPPQPSAPQTDTTAALDTSTTPVPTNLVTVSTTAGDFVIELYGNDAPKTVANFVGLADKKFYEGIAFHRVVKGFVIQGGDPKTKDTTLRAEWGSGSESIYGKEFEDEVNPATPSRRRGYVEGAVAMANSGPNTNGSQFFVILNTQGGTPLASMNSYTIFGFVRSGMDVVHKIEKTGDQGEMPQNPVRIKGVKVETLPTKPTT